jgi:hypothetical protein
MRTLLLALTTLLVAGAAGAGARAVSVTDPEIPANRPAPRGDTSVYPLLRWDLLSRTHYDPRLPIQWPEEVEARNGERVRMEGYLMPRYGSQDPDDLFLTGINPTNLFCGPTDMTLVVELHIPGFAYDTWPFLPVEITGTFHLSRTTRDFRPIYLFLGESWRPLRRWVQPFPGVIESEELDLDDITQ